MRLTAVDLFCGAGGFSYGLANAGIRVICGVDNWSPATKTYTANFRHPILAADVSRLKSRDVLEFAGATEGSVDIVVGGPPCQGFSVQRVGTDRDRRNNLVLAFARMVSEFRPRLFLMENVPGLLGKRGRPFTRPFELALAETGFRMKYALLNAADYGVPQSRRRVFVCGWLEGEREFHFPPPTHRGSDRLTVWDAIGDLPPPPADHTPLPGDPLHRRTRLSALNLRRLGHIPPGGGMQDLPVDLRVPCHRQGARRIGHRFVYGRLAPDRPAATITARFDSFTRGKFGHPYDNRNISLREGARLQSFPDEFSFSGTQEHIAALIGNAVPPALGTVLGLQVVRTLTNARTIDVLDRNLSVPDEKQQLSLLNISNQDISP